MYKLDFAMVYHVVTLRMFFRNSLRVVHVKGHDITKRNYIWLV